MTSVHVLYLGRTVHSIERLLAAVDEDYPPISVSAVPTIDAAISRPAFLQADCLVWDVDSEANSAIERLFSIAPGLPVVVPDARSTPECLETYAPSVTRVDDDSLLEAVRSVRSSTEGDPPSSPSAVLSLLDRSTDRIARIDRDGTYRSVSDGLADDLDSSSTALVGRSVADASLGDPETLLEYGRRAIDSGTIQRDADDSYRYVFVPFGDEQFQLVVQDPEPANDRRGEPANEFIETVLNQLTDIFFVFDLHGRFLHWNDRLSEVTGYSDEEIANMAPMEFFVQEDYGRVESAISEVAESGEATAIARLRTRGGTLLTYEFTGSTIENVGDPTFDTCEHDVYICGTGRDISQRVAAERELEAAIEELERSNAELERFAYVASHDLKEPLRMIRSYLDLIHRRYEGELDDDADEFITYAVDGAERMRTMIDDLLTYSRIGTDDIAVQSVDPDAILDRVLDSLAIVIEEENAEITVESLPTVDGDAQQLGQLFQNLISNAIAYSGDSPPKVHVSASERDDGWQFSIRDHGVGIDPERADEIFEIFSSGPVSSSTGIGLAICKKIVRRHGGEIWVESEPGVGSTFHFRIPESTRSSAGPTPEIPDL